MVRKTAAVVIDEEDTQDTGLLGIRVKREMDRGYPGRVSQAESNRDGGRGSPSAPAAHGGSLP
jgi:hypothetical protein